MLFQLLHEQVRVPRRVQGHERCAEARRERRLARKHKWAHTDKRGGQKSHPSSRATAVKALSSNRATNDGPWARCPRNSGLAVGIGCCVILWFVTCGSEMPRSVPATLAVYPDRKWYIACSCVSSDTGGSTPYASGERVGVGGGGNKALAQQAPGRSAYNLGG